MSPQPQEGPAEEGLSSSVLRLRRRPGTDRPPPASAEGLQSSLPQLAQRYQDEPLPLQTAMEWTDAPMLGRARADVPRDRATVRSAPDDLSTALRDHGSFSPGPARRGTTAVMAILVHPERTELWRSIRLSRRFPAISIRCTWDSALMHLSLGGPIKAPRSGNPRLSWRIDAGFFEIAWSEGHSQSPGTSRKHETRAH